MMRAEPDDFVRPPVEALAQLILQDASDDVSLVKRTRHPAKSLRIADSWSPVARRQDSSPLIVPSTTDLANRRYLEDLVSIAVASAERTDNVLLKTSATHKKTLRAVLAVASVVAVGVAAGVFVMVGSFGGPATDQKLVEVAGQVHSLAQQQQQASRQLSAVRSEIADQRKAATATEHATPPAQLDTSDPQSNTSQRVIVVPGGQPIIQTPLSPLRQATYSTPWPEQADTGQPASYASSWPQTSNSPQAASYSSLWPSRPEPVHTVSTVRRSRVQVPQFFTVIQRNLQMIFR